MQLCICVILVFYGYIIADHYTATLHFITKSEQSLSKVTRQRYFGNQKIAHKQFSMNIFFKCEPRFLTRQYSDNRHQPHEEHFWLSLLNEFLSSKTFAVIQFFFSQTKDMSKSFYIYFSTNSFRMPILQK